MSFGTSRLDIFYAPLLAFLCLFVVPIFIVSSNAADLQHFDATLTIGLLALLALIGAIALTLVAIVLRKLKLGILLLPLRFICFFFLATGLFLPLTTAGGQAEIHMLPLDHFNLAVAFGAATVLFVLSLTPARQALLFGVTVVLIFTGATSSFSAYQSIYTQTPSALRGVSSTRNLFVVSFDGLPSMIGKEILEENAQLRGALLDFTLFENVASNAPATFSSIAAEISGVPDLKDRYESADKVGAALGDTVKLITNQLNENDFIVSTYGSYGMGFTERRRHFSRSSLVEFTGSRTRVLQIGELLIYTTARLASSALVPQDNPLARIAGRLRQHLDGPDQRLTRQLEQHANADWDAPNIIDLLAFRNYRDNLQVETDKPVAHFLHFVHTHFPVDLDSTCEYRSDDAAWVEANMNRHGLKNQTQCALSQFSSFVGKLKEAGIYDNSLIIFKSDHGEPASYYDENRLEAFKIRDHKLWGFGRYAPFLAVKLPDQNASDMIFDTRPVALGDLALSICTSLLNESGMCDSFQGYNIFDPQTVIPADAIYSLEIVKDKTSSFTMNTHDLVNVPRAPGVFAALNDFLTSELLGRAPACGIGLRLDEGTAYNNGLTDGQHWVTWRDGHIASVKTRRPVCALTQITIEVDDGALVESVSMNGTDVPFEQIGANNSTLRLAALQAVGENAHITLSLNSTSMQDVPQILSLTFFD